MLVVVKAILKLYESEWYVMRKDLKILEGKQIKDRKREGQKKYNYINNYEKLNTIEFKEIKNTYTNRLEELANAKLTHNDKSGLYIIEWNNTKVLLRDEVEKRFFLNSFINEYLDYITELPKEEQDKMTFKKYITDISNFLIIKDKPIIVLDTEKDYQ